jgi:hypothetical protein
MSPDSERYVCLKNGPVVPVAPILLLLELEAKGLRLSRDGDDILVSPASKLSDDDRKQLKLWKAHALALLDYQQTVLM